MIINYMKFKNEVSCKRETNFTLNSSEGCTYVGVNFSLWKITL